MNNNWCSGGGRTLNHVLIHVGISRTKHRMLKHIPRRFVRPMTTEKTILVSVLPYTVPLRYSKFLSTLLHSGKGLTSLNLITGFLFHWLLLQFSQWEALARDQRVGRVRRWGISPSAIALLPCSKWNNSLIFFTAVFSTNPALTGSNKHHTLFFTPPG